jgi:hypothetical protein
MGSRDIDEWMKFSIEKSLIVSVWEQSYKENILIPERRRDRRLENIA